VDFFTNPSETVRLPDFENRNNTSRHLSMDQIISSDRRVRLSNEFILRNPANIAISHIFLKTRLFGPRFCCKQHESIFNHFDITGCKATAFGRIMNIMTIMPSSALKYFGTNRKPRCDFLLVIYTIVTFISHLAPFPNYCRIMVKCALSTGGTSL